MSGFRSFLKSGHAPTLFASFVYFSLSCCIWMPKGAMAPFISETFILRLAQKGLMLSIPIIAGALMRFPLGILSQYIGRKRATLVELVHSPTQKPGHGPSGAGNIGTAVSVPVAPALAQAFGMSRDREVALVLRKSGELAQPMMARTCDTDIPSEIALNLAVVKCATVHAPLAPVHGAQVPTTLVWVTPSSTTKSKISFSNLRSKVSMA